MLTLRQQSHPDRPLQDCSCSRMNVCVNVRMYICSCKYLLSDYKVKARSGVLNSWGIGYKKNSK